MNHGVPAPAHKLMQQRGRDPRLLGPEGTRVELTRQGSLCKLGDKEFSCGKLERGRLRNMASGPHSPEVDALLTGTQLSLWHTSVITWEAEAGGPRVQGHPSYMRADLSATFHVDECFAYVYVRSEHGIGYSGTGVMGGC